MSQPMTTGKKIPVGLLTVNTLRVLGEALSCGYSGQEEPTWEDAQVLMDFMLENGIVILSAADSGKLGPYGNLWAEHLRLFLGTYTTHEQYKYGIYMLRLLESVLPLPPGMTVPGMEQP